MPVGPVEGEDRPTTTNNDRDKNLFGEAGYTIKKKKGSYKPTGELV